MRTFLWHGPPYGHFNAEMRICLQSERMFLACVLSIFESRCCRCHCSEMHCLTKLARYEVPMVDVGFYAGQKFFQFNRQKVNCEANNKVSRCGKLIVALVFCSFLKCVSGAQFKYVVPRSQGAGYCFLWLQTRNTARNCSMFCMTDEIR